MSDHESCTISDISTILSSHPSFANAARIGVMAGGPGYGIAGLDGLERVTINKDNRASLEHLGVRFPEPISGENTIFLHPQMPKADLEITFTKHSGNVILLSRESKLRAKLFVAGDDNILAFGSSANYNAVSTTIRDNRCGLLLGDNSSCGSVNFWIEGPDCSVLIGEECMLSWGIFLRTSDAHAIIDLETGEKVNQHRSVVIEPHVWIGQDSIVSPGCSIGAGSIIGARSLVTKDIPGCCTAAGTPARVIKTGVSWTRSGRPSRHEIDLLMNSPYLKRNIDGAG